MLSLKPCCADNDCMSKALIHQKEQGRKLPAKDKECQGCSPFFTCGTCAGFVIVKKLTFDLSIITESQELTYFDYQQPFVKEISLSIWQPPKLS
jgi:hypothetical protein